MRGCWWLGDEELFEVVVLREGVVGVRVGDRRSMYPAAGEERRRVWDWEEGRNGKSNTGETLPLVRFGCSLSQSNLSYQIYPRGLVGKCKLVC